MALFSEIVKTDTSVECIRRQDEALFSLGTLFWTFVCGSIFIDTCRSIQVRVSFQLALQPTLILTAVLTGLILLVTLFMLSWHAYLKFQTEHLILDQDGFRYVTKFRGKWRIRERHLLEDISGFQLQYEMCIPPPENETQRRKDDQDARNKFAWLGILVHLKDNPQGYRWHIGPFGDDECAEALTLTENLNETLGRLRGMETPHYDAETVYVNYCLNELPLEMEVKARGESPVCSARPEKTRWRLRKRNGRLTFFYGKQPSGCTASCGMVVLFFFLLLFVFTACEIMDPGYGGEGWVGYARRLMWLIVFLAVTISFLLFILRNLIREGEYRFFSFDDETFYWKKSGSEEKEQHCSIAGWTEIKIHNARPQDKWMRGYWGEYTLALRDADENILAEVTWLTLDEARWMRDEILRNF